MVAVFGVTSCGSDDDRAGPGRPGFLIDALAGPQGRVPQFVVECAFSHQNYDDPIVYPGQPGESHLHQFFGNHTTDAFSTYESLRAGQTTCNDQLDTAAYWAPALLDAGQVVEPTRSVSYYRPGLGVDPTTIEPYPPGLEMLSTLTAWTCGTGSERLPEPPATCTDQALLHVVVVFPNCWNGTDVRTDDHLFHVAYSQDGRCPASHPHPIPQLTLTVEYPISGAGHELSLASGDISTAHADFFNAWDETKLRHDIALCLGRDVVCSVSR